MLLLYPLSDSHIGRTAASLAVALLLESGIPGEADPAAFVNPFIGTANGGNTFPGAVVPFGMVLRRANGRTLTITAPEAAADAPYVQSLRVNGQPATRPWLPESFVENGGTLDYHLSATPNLQWGSRPEDAPPSFDAP